MNVIRWIFFLVLATLLINSCTHATAEFDSHAPNPAAITQDLPTD